MRASNALAVSCLIFTACSFALFMKLALYLVGAKIENNLRDIGESLRAFGWDLR